MICQIMLYTFHQNVVWTIPVDPVILPIYLEQLLSQDSFMRHIKQPNHKRKGCETAPGLLRFQVTFTVLVWSTDKPKPSLGFKYPFRDCRQREYLIIHRKSDFLTKQKRISRNIQCFWSSGLDVFVQTECLPLAPHWRWGLEVGDQILAQPDNARCLPWPRPRHRATVWWRPKEVLLL